MFNVSHIDHQNCEFVFPRLSVFIQFVRAVAEVENGKCGAAAALREKLADQQQLFVFPDWTDLVHVLVLWSPYRSQNIDRLRRDTAWAVIWKSAVAV